MLSLQALKVVQVHPCPDDLFSLVFVQPRHPKVLQSGSCLAWPLFQRVQGEQKGSSGVN